MATAGELAQFVGLPVEGDELLGVIRVRGLDRAGPDDISYVSDAAYRQQALDSPVRVLVAPHGLELPGKTVIRSDTPQWTLVQLTPLLHPEPEPPVGAHPSAVQGADCLIAASASIGPNAVLGDRVTVGEGCVVGPGVVLGDDVQVGEDTVLHANVTVERGCVVGSRCIVHAGTVIGSDGYGFLQYEGRHIKIPQVGNVVVEDDVELGANNAIDRATYDSTVIGHGTKTDNLVHIAHNVHIGPHALLLGQVGFAGSTRVGAYFTISGQAGVADHLDVPDHVTVGPRSLLTRPGRSGEAYYGYPARPVREWRRSVALFNSLDRLVQRLNRLVGKGEDKDTAGRE